MQTRARRVRRDGTAKAGDGALVQVAATQYDTEGIERHCRGRVERDCTLDGGQSLRVSMQERQPSSQLGVRFRIALVERDRLPDEIDSVPDLAALGRDHSTTQHLDRLRRHVR